MDDLISRAAAIEAVYYKPNHKMAIEVLKEVPAVDAIPIEWLKQKMKHPDNYTRGSAKWMLGCWKREQEVQDG